MRKLYLTIYFFVAGFELFAQQNQVVDNESILPVKNLNISGSMKVYEKQGFKMAFPTGWEIINNQEDGKPFEAIAPKLEDDLYRGNIKIMRFGREISLNNQSTREVAELLRRRHNFLGYVSGFSIRSSEFIDIGDKTTAILFYSDLTVNNVKLMQAHLAVPAHKSHYLITYTDLQEHFEGEKSHVFLDKVWHSLSSFVPLNPPRTTTQKLARALPWAGLVLFLLFGAIFGRKMWERREEQIEPVDQAEFADDESVITSRVELESIISEKVNRYQNSWTPSPLAKKFDEFSGIASNIKEDQEVLESDFIEDDDDDLIAV